MAVETDTTLDGNETRSTNLDDYKSSKTDKSHTISTASINTIKTDKAESDKDKGSLSKSSSATSGRVVAKMLPKSILTNSPSRTPPPPPPRMRRLVFRKY